MTAQTCMFDGTDPLWSEPPCTNPATVQIQPIPPAEQFEEPPLACDEHAQAIVELNDAEGDPVRHHVLPLAD